MHKIHNVQCTPVDAHSQKIHLGEHWVICLVLSKSAPVIPIKLNPFTTEPLAIFLELETENLGVIH